MKTHEFIDRLDEAKIVAEIATAEGSTSGEIRVFISRRAPDDAVARARQRFEKLGMTRTRHRNAVLIYFAPRVQKFAVIGDSGVHEKCGLAFWEETVAEIGDHLRGERFTEAVQHAVRKVGAVLARHFPPEPGTANELPNDLLRD
ncbi:MAG: TPM domain-containing protein [Chthoniobacter sp.]|uniref:TPM domain-containing protein n=1 Tax=Chthoniobacter sp. TaxID=2510640 RepID=UPI0032AA441F